MENLQAINEQAQKRFEEECKKIKQIRKFEREEFNWQKKKQDMIALHNLKMRRQNNLNNLQQLARQIEEDKQKKQIQTLIDKQYYKTHFGPEETDELIIKQQIHKEAKRMELLTDLERQMALNQILRSSSKEDERQSDINNLDVAQSTYLAEQRAL